MSTITTEQVASLSGPNQYLLRRLHSLSGIVPLGAFLLEHFFTNSYATYGPTAFDEAVEKISSFPYLVLIETVTIFLPLLYHGVYGLFIAYQGQPNAFTLGYPRNWMYTLQRVTGIISFVFIGWHLWMFRIRKVIEPGYAITFDNVARELSVNWIFALYAIGILAAVFHLANGFWSFGVSWGITVSRQSQRISGYACFAFGVAFALIGINALLAFRQLSLGQGILF